MEILYTKVMSNLCEVAQGTTAKPMAPHLPKRALTPESLTDHVKTFSMDLLGAWHAHYADVSEEEAGSMFDQRLGSALERGIREAKGLVESLNVFSEDLLAISEFVGPTLEPSTKGKNGLDEWRRG